MLEKHPTKVPIIIQKANHSLLNTPEKYKYLTPKEQTMASFQFEIRKRLSINAAQSLFLFINGTTIPPFNATMGEIYEKMPTLMDF